MMRRKFLLRSHSGARYIYGRFFKKNKPWVVTRQQLLNYPEGSLGLSVGKFLAKNQIELVAKFENHDVMHVLIDIGISLVEEIALKCYLLGNGRLNIYHLLTTISGVALYPEKYAYFKHYYQQGKRATSFYCVDFRALLTVPTEELRQRYLIDCRKYHGEEKRLSS